MLFADFWVGIYKLESRAPSPPSHPPPEPALPTPIKEPEPEPEQQLQSEPEPEPEPQPDDQAEKEQGGGLLGKIGRFFGAEDSKKVKGLGARLSSPRWCCYA